MKSTFGNNIRVSIWGGSHEPAIGVDIQGLPEEITADSIDMNKLQEFMDRRAPGNSPFATKRKEPDIPVLIENAPKGTLSFEIRNTDTRSSDYKGLRTVPRPGHADYTARLRYGDDLNMAGGGPFSARMTAPLCIAGGIALQYLEAKGVTIGAHLYSIADVQDTPFDPVNVNKADLASLKGQTLATLSEAAAAAMEERILTAKKALDSVGGVVEVCALGLPAGIGGAMYDGLESYLAPIYFGIPAVKGIEFGAGFSATRLKGSVNNDPFYYDGTQVKTRTNNHGGILGGITSGMPLIARLAFKPTPSISQEQDSVDLETGKDAKLVVKGRHDPCVAVRGVPVVEAATALGILDCMMSI